MTVWTPHITWSLSTITATIHGICGHVNIVLRSISYKRTLSLTAHYSFMKECWQCILKKEIKLLSRKNRDAVWSSIKCWHITTSWWTKCPLHTTHSVNNKQTRREHKKKLEHLLPVSSCGIEMWYSKSNLRVKSWMCQAFRMRCRRIKFSMKNPCCIPWATLTWGFDHENVSCKLSLTH